VASASGLQVYIGATSADLAKGLEDAKRMIDGWAREAVARLNASGTGARSAGKEFDSLGETFKAFTRTQRTEGRAAGFFVTEFLSPLVGQSRLAKEGLGALGAALIGGTGVGFAIEAVGFGTKLLGDYLKESGDKAREAAEAHKKAAEKMTAAYDQARASLQKLKFVQATGRAPGAAERFEATEQAAPFRAEMASLENDLARARAKRAEIEGALGGRQPSRTEDPAVWRIWNEQVQKEIALVTELAEARDRLRVIEEQGGAVAAGAAEKERFAREHENIQVLDAHVQAYYKHIEEEEKKLAAQERDRALHRDQGFAELEAPAFGPVVVDGQAAYNKRLKETIALSREWGQTLGNVLAQVALGQLTLGQAVQQVGQMIVQGVIQTAVRFITVKAAEAFAAAFVSKASIPIVGPEIGLAEGIAAQSTILGLLATVGSASRGYRVPDWVGSAGAPTMLHGGEHVLPKSIARNYEGGGRRGGGLTMNLYGAGDARDVRRMLEDELPRVYRRLQRQGAL